MDATLAVESTLTDRYQTTVPETVRRVLHLGKRDKIQYTIHPGGQVVLSRVETPEEDPVLGRFLDFLALDMVDHPEHLQKIAPALVARSRALVENVDVDVNLPLQANDE